MALIRATCEDCGDIELRSRDVRLRVCAETGEANWTFRCPVCRFTQVKYANNHAFDILASAGVPQVTWHLPVIEMPQFAVDLTEDDLIDFHDALGTVVTINDLQYI